MKLFSKTFYVVALTFFLSISLHSFSQNSEQSDSLRTKLTDAAKEIMASAGTCALITLDEKGLPAVRTMDPFLPESDFTVWFGTNPNSRKVKQIENNPNVTLYYLDKDSSGYAVLHGMAELVNDQNEKEKHWKPEWKDFYPNKAEGYILIKVCPKWMKVLSMTRGIRGDPSTWETPIVEFDFDH